MRAAPVLRGGLVARLVWLVAGLFLFSCGIVFFLASRLGLPPWDVLHQGIAKHTPLSFGVANEVVGVLVLVARLGARRPGRHRHGRERYPDRRSSSCCCSRSHAVHDRSASRRSRPRSALLVVGLVLLRRRLGALHRRRRSGPGPRDSLMLVGARRTGLRARLRSARLIESTVLLVGFCLGGRVGVGTVVFAALIGPAVESVVLALLSHRPRTLIR